MEDKFIYYVYAYLRINGTPYYIGKGKHNRAFVKHNSVGVPKNKNRIVFLEKSLSEIGALALERRYIKWYGKISNGTGILRNFTDGGDGVSGVSRPDLSTWNRSEEAGRLNKLRDRKYMQSDEYRLKMSLVKSGCIVSKDTRDRISKSLIGREVSETTIRKIKQKYYDTKVFKYSYNGIDFYKIDIDASIGQTLKSRLNQLFSCSYQLFAKYSNTGNPVKSGSAKGIYFMVE